MHGGLTPYCWSYFLQGTTDYANSITELPLAKLMLQQLHELAAAWPAAHRSDEWVAAIVLKMYPQRPADELSVAERDAFLLDVQQFCHMIGHQVCLETLATRLATKPQQRNSTLCLLLYCIKFYSRNTT